MAVAAKQNGTAPADSREEANAAALAQARAEAHAAAREREAAAERARVEAEARNERMREYEEGAPKDERYVIHPDYPEMFSVPPVGDFAVVRRGRRNRPKDRTPVIYLTNGNAQSDLPLSAIAAAIKHGLVPVRDVIDRWTPAQRAEAMELLTPPGE